jgi:hypothetical protein
MFRLDSASLLRSRSTLAAAKQQSSRQQSSSPPPLPPVNPTQPPLLC